MTDDRPVDPSRWTIEALDVARDLDAILEVDAACFNTPWTRAMYDEYVEQPEVAHLVVLRIATEELAGYCSFLTVLDEIHINNVAVHPRYRGRGYGAALVERVLALGCQRGATGATLEVRRSNHVARRLYLRLGFKEEGRRRNYYAAPMEDALILWKRGLATAELRSTDS